MQPVGELWHHISAQRAAIQFAVLRSSGGTGQFRGGALDKGSANENSDPEDESRTSGNAVLASIPPLLSHNVSGSHAVPLTLRAGRTERKPVFLARGFCFLGRLQVAVEESVPVPKRGLRLREAADYLGVSRWLLRQFAHQGKLAYIQYAEGGPWWFDLRDLDKFMEQHKQ